MSVDQCVPATSGEPARQPDNRPDDRPAVAPERIGVVGCGVMGAGLAQLCAMEGLDVVVVVSGTSSVELRRGRLRAALDRSVRKGRLTHAEAADVHRRVMITADVGDLADRELVFEAAPEDEELKTEIFATLDKVVQHPDAILASNTSSIPVMRLAAATTRPERVMGAHFFNPATRMPLVEVVETLLTDRAKADRLAAFLTDVLGKRVVRVRDRSGFVVNALLFPYIMSAIRMLESGFASADDIDDAMVLGCNHPMGPLRLADLVGLDVVHAIGESLHAEFREPHHAPPPLLRRMVDAGLLGVKTGRGFHVHTTPE
ncbi:3-hydroxybutyryl-CoA dehydrogenase [Jiangella asiatica]|uniref:3-hydroxybutyryl-CoA dehydrogenase n=1 Tax=Jiangella asiatica TaxID=2530372 RepID=A0A4V2Z2Z3_9ACTN|nr:3-hydroxybutyryl-CoA dehydrogenase [Jiangella asiatica]TDE10598.1 3-hydroxybutyryl-CoA dehydrogenase [Jiangella asiatica]